MTPHAGIVSAIKRSASMGRRHEKEISFNSHPLAACVSNYADCIDAEITRGDTDYLAVIGFLNIMADKINDYCTNNKIAGDHAAEYWLNEFNKRSRSVCDFTKLAK